MTAASIIDPGLGRDTFVFWQRTLSPHNAALVATLASNPAHHVLVLSSAANRRTDLPAVRQGCFGSAEVLTATEDEAMLRIATLPADRCVHLVEGADHPVWDCLPVIEHWVEHRPRILLLEQGHIEDGVAGRRHTRALRGLARLGGQLISALLVHGTHPIHQFHRLGFAEVLPFAHIARDPHGALKALAVNNARPAAHVVTPGDPGRNGGWRPEPHSGAGEQGQRNADPHFADGSGPRLRAVEGGLVRESGTAATAPTEVDARHVSALAGAQYLQDIVYYLDHPGAERPVAPWRPSPKVRYRRG